MRRGSFAVTNALAVLTACGSTEEIREPRNPAGCYQIEQTAEARALGLPWGFELRRGALEGWPTIQGGHTAVTRVTWTRTADHPFAYWRRTEGDSIEVAHPGGGGFSLTLVQEDLRLVGYAVAVGDAVQPGESFGPRPPQPIVAHQVLCEPAG